MGRATLSLTRIVGLYLGNIGPSRGKMNRISHQRGSRFNKVPLFYRPRSLIDGLQVKNRVRIPDSDSEASNRASRLVSWLIPFVKFDSVLVLFCCHVNNLARARYLSELRTLCEGMNEERA